MTCISNRPGADSQKNQDKKEGMAISEIIDVIGHAVEGMAVWRYLFSPAYRRSVHELWRSQSRLETAMDIFYFSLSFIFVTAIVGALAWWSISIALHLTGTNGLPKWPLHALRYFVKNFARLGLSLSDGGSGHS